MRVPFFDYSLVYETERAHVTPIIQEVLTRSDFILREDLLRFELEMSIYSNSKFMVGVANGTDAIWLSLKAMGIGEGDEVILPSHTYVATADAVRFVGATPVLVDCDTDHNILVQAIEDAIGKNTAAIIPVNLNGRACRLEEISKLAGKNGLVMVEDNAQGLGARLNNKSTGTFGEAGTLSFFPAKNLGCYGDGGGILTQSEKMAESLRKLRNHGRDESGNVVDWGFNSRLDNLQAAILSVKLRLLDKSIERRRQIAYLYWTKLGSIGELKLPPKPDSESNYFDSYQNFEIEAEHRDQLVMYLKEQGIGTSLPWGGKAVHHFKLSGCIEKDLSNTERLFKKIMLLPMNQYLTDEAIDSVCSSIITFYEKRPNNH
jgi:dTDP-4-amino-4,6-dideoxygalactose transaminase